MRLYARNGGHYLDLCVLSELCTNVQLSLASDDISSELPLYCVIIPKSDSVKRIMAWSRGFDTDAQVRCSSGRVFGLWFVYIYICGRKHFEHRSLVACCIYRCVLYTDFDYSFGIRLMFVNSIIVVYTVVKVVSDLHVVLVTGSSQNYRHVSAA